MTELVKRVMRDAHIDTTDPELVELIAQHLGGFRYEPSALASWRSGRYRPPAEAIFAVALARGLHLDDYLYSETTARRLDEIETDLRKVLARLEVVAPESGGSPRGDA